MSFFKERELLIKWNKTYSCPNPVNGGGHQCGGTAGVLEYTSQNTSNLDFLPEDECYHFVDDASILEVINLVHLGHQIQLQSPHPFRPAS